MLEMVAITLDGAHAAERALSDLRATRDDPWLTEVSIIEHDTDGRYSVKAKNPHVEDRQAGKGAAPSGRHGALRRRRRWSVRTAPVEWHRRTRGRAIGAGKESAFLPMVDGLEARLAPAASMLILAGETPALEALVSAVVADDGSVLRQSLTNEQANELTNAAS